MSLSVVRKVLDKKIPNNTHKVLLLAMAECCKNIHDLDCFPGTKFLTWRTQFARNTIKSARKKLLEQKWLLVVKQGQGRGHKTVFRLNLDAIPDLPKWEKKGPQIDPLSGDAEAHNQDANGEKRGQSENGKGVNSHQEKGSNHDAYIQNQIQIQNLDTKPLSNVPHSTDSCSSSQTKSDAESIVGKRKQSDNPDAVDLLIAEHLDSVDAGINDLLAWHCGKRGRSSHPMTDEERSAARERFEDCSRPVWRMYSGRLPWPILMERSCGRFKTALEKSMAEDPNREWLEVCDRAVFQRAGVI